MLKRFLLLAVSLPAVAVAQTPPANVTMQNGQPRAVTPTAIVDANGAQLGTAANPINVTGSTSGGGSSVPTGSAGSPNAAVVTVQGISGGTPQNVTVTNPTAQGLTDTQLRASAVPVTGPLTDTQLRANPVNVTVATALPTGANTIGSIGNTSFGISGSLPAGTNAIGTVTAVGAGAGGATATGNPIGIGGVYTTPTLPLYTTGQRSDLQSDARGNLRVKPAFAAVTRADGVTYQPGFPNVDNAASTLTLPVVTQLGFNGTSFDYTRFVSGSDGTGLGVNAVAETPTSAAGGAIVPVTALNATALLGKAAPGNLFGATLTASTAAGFLVIANLAAVPASGTALTAAQVLYCVPVGANGAGTAGGTGIPDRATVGLTLLFSTSCNTYTPVGTAALHMRIRAQ